MKAPDKIYLGIQDLGSGYTYALSLDNNGETEYIRKDKIIEVLESFSNPTTKLFVKSIVEGLNEIN